MSIQLICPAGHVTTYDFTPADGEIAHIRSCPKPVNGPAGRVVACGARAIWKRTRPAIADGRLTGARP